MWDLIGFSTFKNILSSDFEFFLHDNCWPLGQCSPQPVYICEVYLQLKSIRIHLVLRFCTVSWSYFDEF